MLVLILALRYRQAIWRSGSSPGEPVDQWAGDESSNTKIKWRIESHGV